MDNLEEFVQKKEHLLKLKEHRHHKHIEDIYHQKVSGKYLGDFVYGGNDGIITTFSVVAGALGASFSPTIVTGNKKVWVDEMMKNELGIIEES